MSFVMPWSTTSSANAASTKQTCCSAREGTESCHRLPLLKLKLQMRVGIATGLVVVGDLIGSGAAQEEAVVGETPNLAARLQGLAAPNTVVIAADTRRLTGGLFEYCDLGAATLKGFADPVRAWHVVGPSAIESRFEAMHAAQRVGGLFEIPARSRSKSRGPSAPPPKRLRSGKGGSGGLTGGYDCSGLSGPRRVGRR